MKLSYYRETDSLYIELSATTSVDSREISDGVVVDYDASGNPVGIDIDNVRNTVELDRLVLRHIDAEISTVAG